MTERRLALGLFSGVLLFCAGATAQPASDCSLPWSRDEALQRLGWLRPPAAAAWTMRSVELAGCDETSRRRVRLWLEPPQKWSRLGIAYRQPVERLLLADGRAADTGAQVSFQPLRRTDVESLEALLAVRRFAERYPPVEAVVGSRCEGKLPVLLRGCLPGRKPGERPELGLLLANGHRDPVDSYQLPGIDALPGRRELLRFAESLSDHHPLCRAAWVRAQRMNDSGPAAPGNGQATEGANGSNGAGRCRFPLGDCLEAAFGLEGRLVGPGCPERYSVTVDQQLATSPGP